MFKYSMQNFASPHNDPAEFSRARAHRFTHNTLTCWRQRENLPWLQNSSQLFWRLKNNRSIGPLATESIGHCWSEVFYLCVQRATSNTLFGWYLQSSTMRRSQATANPEWCHCWEPSMIPSRNLPRPRNSPRGFCTNAAVVVQSLRNLLQTKVSF